MECLDQVWNLFKDQFSKQEVQAIIEELQKERAGYFKSTDGPSAAGFQERVMNFLAERRIALIEQRKQALYQYKKVASNTEIAMQKSFRKDPWQAVIGQMLGGETRVNVGGNTSPRLVADNFRLSLQSDLTSAVERARFEKQAKDGSLDLPLAQEIYRRAMGEPSSGAEVSKGSPLETVHALADVVHGVNNRILEFLQNSGSKIRGRLGFVANQIYDSTRVRELGFDQWRAAIEKHCDFDDIFKNYTPEEREEKLLNDYDSIVNGTFRTPEINFKPETGVKTFSKNLSEKTSRSLFYVPRSAEDFVALNQMMGKKPLLPTIHDAIRRAANDGAAMQLFGAEPDRGFAMLKENIRDQLKNAGDHETLEKFNAQEANMNQAYQVMRGISDQPGKTTGAKMVQAATQLQSASKLGNVIPLKAPNDILNATNILHNSGLLPEWHSILTNWAREIKDPSEQTRQFKSLANSMEYMSGSWLEGADEGKPGALSKFTNTIMKIQGMHWQTAIMQNVVAKVIQEHLGDLSGTAFEDLPRATQRTLERYGITTPEWRILQRSVESVGDTKLMTPEAIGQLGKDPDLRTIVESQMHQSGELTGDARFYNDQITKKIQEVESKFGAMLQDHINAGTTSPGLRDKALLLQGTHADTKIGMLLRLAAQFKQVTTSMVRQTGRTMMNSADASNWADTLKSPSAYKALGSRAAVLMMGGAITYMLTHLEKGEPEIPDVTKPSVALELAARSGFAGPLADVLHASQFDDSMAKGALKWLAGPTLSQGIDAASIFDKKYGRETGAAYKEGKALDLVTSNIPGQNLYFVRYLMQKYIKDAYHEALQPGYTERKQMRNLMEESR